MSRREERRESFGNSGVSKFSAGPRRRDSIVSVLVHPTSTGKMAGYIVQVMNNIYLHYLYNTLKLPYMSEVESDQFRFVAGVPIWQSYLDNITPIFA
jgi:hypothetical protein